MNFLDTPLQNYTAAEVRDICKAAPHCLRCRFYDNGYCPLVLSFRNKVDTEVVE